MFKHLWPWSKIAQLEADLRITRNALAQDRVQIARGRASYELVRDANHRLGERVAEQDRLLEKAFFQNPLTRRMMKKGVRP